MNEPIYFDEEFKKQWRYAFEQARADRERYFNWLKDEMKIAIDLINRYDKIYVLGGLGARLLQASPNLYNQFMETYTGKDKEHAEAEKILEDDEIEVLLEYAMSIASASPNTNTGNIPTIENIDEIVKSGQTDPLFFIESDPLLFGGYCPPLCVSFSEQTDPLRIIFG